MKIIRKIKRNGCLQRDDVSLILLERTWLLLKTYQYLDTSEDISVPGYF